MKKVVISYIMILAVIASCTQKKPVEKTILGMGTEYFLFPETLNGKIKEIKEQNYWAIEKDGKITRGNLITWEELDSIPSTKNFIAYFDPSGKLTRYDRLDENNSIRDSDIAMVENGKIVKWESKVEDSITYYGIPQYDSLNFIVGIKVYRPVNDTLVFEQVFKHDGKGNYTKIESFNHNGDRISYHDLILDEVGKVIEENFYRKDTLANTMKIEYDENDNMIKQEVFVKSESVSNWDTKEIAADEKGNSLEIFCDVDDGKYKILIVRTYVYY